LGREPRHQAHRDRVPRIRGALQVQALPVSRSDCCHCGTITGTAQSRAQSLAGSAPSSIRSKPASSFLGGTQSYQLRPCTCTTEGRVLCGVFSFMRRVDGRGRKDWLAAAFAENAAPTRVAQRRRTHIVPWAFLCQEPEPATRHGPGQPARGVSVWKRNSCSHRRAGELQFA